MAFPMDNRPSSVVALSLLYVGLCRILGLVVSCRRTESDWDIEIMVLRRQVCPRARSVRALGPHLRPRARTRGSVPPAGRVDVPVLCEFEDAAA
jgi:hypothetical protein